jgi:hypothetical protein
VGNRERTLSSAGSYLGTKTGSGWMPRYQASGGQFSEGMTVPDTSARMDLMPEYFSASARKASRDLWSVIALSMVITPPST